MSFSRKDPMRAVRDRHLGQNDTVDAALVSPRGHNARRRRARAFENDANGRDHGGASAQSVETRCRL